MKTKKLIDAHYSEFENYDSQQLLESILLSEGRVVLSQANADYHNIIDGCTSAELCSAFGADMIMMKPYHFINKEYNVGLDGKSFSDIKILTRCCIGTFMDTYETIDEISFSDNKDYFKGVIASKENINAALEEGVKFITIGTNPGMKTNLDDVIKTVARVKKIVGNRALIMAGKWQDGVAEKVLGDLDCEYDQIKVTKDLIDAGADVIVLPAIGSRASVTVDSIRPLASYVHKRKKAVMCFIGASIEGTEKETIRQIAMLSKQAGADIYGIGDAGYVGVAEPENYLTLALTVKGRRYTFKRMAGRNR